MRILGIDPGLDTTGYGVIEVCDREIILIEGGVVRTGSADDPLELRLSRLYEGITEIIEEFRPQAMALEKLYSHYDHPTTAILMGHARGVICLSAARKGVPVHSYAATQIKSCLTGNGRATKEHVQRVVQARLKLPNAPEPHDAADALAAAICHWWMSHSPVAEAAKERFST